MSTPPSEKNDGSVGDEQLAAALEEIRGEADECCISWPDLDCERTTTIAWIVYCARNDPDATVTPLTG